MGDRQITERMRAFVREYLGEAKLNASEAARRAGYTGEVKVRASQLLDHPWVKAEIEKGMRERAEKTGITAERVVEELRRIAMADPLDAFDENGELRPLKEVPEDLRRTISSIDTETKVSEEGVTTVVRKIRFWPKDKTLELLGRHLAMFQDKSKVELTGKDGESLQIVIKTYGPEDEEKK